MSAPSWARQGFTKIITVAIGKSSVHATDKGRGIMPLRIRMIRHRGPYPPPHLRARTAGGAETLRPRGGGGSKYSTLDPQTC